MNQQLTLGDNVEAVSYEVVKGLQSHCDFVNNLLNKELLLREELKKMLGLDRESWNTLIAKAAKEVEYSHKELDPFAVLKDVRSLMSRIYVDSPDVYARTIAEQVLNFIGETLEDTIPSIPNKTKKIVEGN